MRWISIVLIFLAVAYTACSGSQRPDSPEVEHKDEEGQVFIGLASYYGSELEGKKTASGEQYDPTKMTAAHRTLPFGTRVSITNLENNRTVIATITDRGPQQPDRIIDVSLNVATELMMLPSGVVKVRVEVLKNEQ